MVKYTDIARECVTSNMEAKENKLDFGCFESIVKIDSVKKEKYYGKAKGEYYLLDCPNLHALAPVVYEYIIEQVASYLRYKIKKITNKQNYKVLVVCLGNENIVSDSLGASVFSNLITTPFSDEVVNDKRKSFNNAKFNERHMRLSQENLNAKISKIYAQKTGNVFDDACSDVRLTERDRAIMEAYESGVVFDDLPKNVHIHSFADRNCKKRYANNFNNEIKMHQSQNILQAVKTSVFGKTGIDTAKLTKGIKDIAEPDVVILIDSLCSSSLNRIGTSIQISDSGLVAGGAIGRQGTLINALYLKCPTLAIGIPFVVRVETIVNEILSTMSDVGIDDSKTISNKCRNLLVAPKEIDSMVELGAHIVASAINLAVLDFSTNEQRLMKI